MYLVEGINIGSVGSYHSLVSMLMFDVLPMLE